MRLALSLTAAIYYLHQVIHHDRYLALLFVSLLCTCGRAHLKAQSDTSEGALEMILSELDSTWRDAPEHTIRLTDSLLTVHADVDSSLLVSLLLYRARARRSVGDYVDAIGEWKPIYAYATAHRDSQLLVEAADQIGMMNIFMGNLEEGQPYLIQVAGIFDRIGSTADRAGALNGLAILYADLEQDAEAILNYEQSLALYEEADDTLGRASVHANLGMLYLDQDKYKLTEFHLLEQGRLDSLLETQYGLAFHYDFLGALRWKQGRLPEALQLCERSLAIRKTLASDYNRAESHISVAGILIDLGRYDEAIGHAQTVLDFRDDHQSLTQESNALNYLSMAYEKKGATGAALRYHKAYKIIADSIYQRDRLSEIADKNALYEKAKRDEEIARLGQQGLLQEASINRKNKALWIVGLGIAFVSLFAFSLWGFLRKISRQRDELAVLDQQKDLLLREIHHRVKNNLQMVSSLLSLQSDFIEDARAQDAIRMGRQRVRSMAIIHQKLYMRDQVSTKISTREYLDQLISELLHTLNVKGVALQLEKNLEDIDLDIDRIIPLGLIANEVITNAMKHAFTGRESGKLTVTFRRLDQRVELCITDDGHGLSEAFDGKTDSFGNLLIRTFAEQLEGELSVDGDDGTMVCLRFPYALEAVAG